MEIEIIVRPEIFSFEKNRKQEISINQYYRNKVLSLGKWVSSKKIVYLDTKFWLILRDVSLSRDVSLDSKMLYDNIVALAKAEVCIFPISEDIFLEIIRQSDSSTLNETIRLIDLLSFSVSMIGFEERINLEYKYFTSHVEGKTLHDCSELVWTKLFYTLGFIIPIIEGSIGRISQQEFIDYTWSISMAKIISTIKENGDTPPIKMRFCPDRMNDGKFKHAHENKSFKQMFLSELAGALDAYQEIFLNSIIEMYESTTGMSINQSDIENPEFARPLMNMIYNVFRLNKDKNHFSTLRITSGLHAAVRWDTNQRFQENDYHDFRHAASAILYCDYFFTEKRLAHLVTQKITGYDKQYNCNVQSSVYGANKVLSELLVLI